MDLPDTLNSWFLVTELHVWMLMARAMEVEKEGRILRNNIVEAMWSDLMDKSKLLGEENKSLAKKQIPIIVDQFQAAIIAYDEGVLTNDKVLASALWRRFFNRNCDDAENLETMVKYVRQQMHYLDNLSEDDFMMLKINLIPLDRRKM